MVARPAHATERERPVLEKLIASEGTEDQQAAVDRLLAEFETAAAAIWGSPARLRRAGVDDRVVGQLSAVRTAILHILAQPIGQRPLVSNWGALIDYLTAEMGFRLVERVRVLYLDTQLGLIRNELLTEGTIDEAPVHVREVMRRALELGAASLILVHNHPSGDPAPSRADIRLSQAVGRAGETLGVTLHDHLIVAGSRHVSLRSMGVLRD